jgi:putative hemolysin
MERYYVREHNAVKHNDSADRMGTANLAGSNCGEGGAPRHRAVIEEELVDVA